MGINIIVLSPDQTDTFFQVQRRDYIDLKTKARQNLEQVPVVASRVFHGYNHLVLSVLLEKSLDGCKLVIYCRITHLFSLLKTDVQSFTANVNTNNNLFPKFEIMIISKKIHQSSSPP